ISKGELGERLGTSLNGFWLSPIYIIDGILSFIQGRKREMKECKYCGDEIEPGYEGYDEGVCEICYTEDLFDEYGD
ncbi:TPA: hypothetical protein ACOQ31_005570, partial [Bacillus cereus]